jgi:hypothetical protein
MKKMVWSAAAVAAALALTGAAAADSADKKDGKNDGPAFRQGGRGGRGGRGISADQIVERLLSFDKDKDGKLTKDELPERMQDLLAKGDTNKDGALDKDEIKALADKLQREGFGGRGGPGGFPGGRFAGFGPPGGSAQRALNELNLSDAKKKEVAETAVKAYEENVRKLMELARADLLLKMKDTLSEADFKKFKETLESPPRFGRRPR